MKKLIEKLFGIHFHTWGKWEDEPGWGWSFTVQHRHCKTCNKLEKFRARN